MLHFILKKIVLSIPEKRLLYQSEVVDCIVVGQLFYPVQEITIQSIAFPAEQTCCIFFMQMILKLQRIDFDSVLYLQGFFYASCYFSLFGYNVPTIDIYLTLITCVFQKVEADQKSESCGENFRQSYWRADLYKGIMERLVTLHSPFHVCGGSWVIRVNTEWKGTVEAQMELFMIHSPWFEVALGSVVNLCPLFSENRKMWR